MWPLYVALGCGLIAALLACLLQSKAAKVLLSILSISGFFVAALMLALLIQYSFIGPRGTWLAFLVCGAAFAILMLFVWRPFRAKMRRFVMISLAAGTIMVMAVFTLPLLYQNSLVVPQTEEINLSEYAPFGEYRYKEGRLVNLETKAARLAEEATLKLQDNLPRLDGATALYPLYAAFVGATYPAPEPAAGIPAYNPYASLRDMEDASFAVCSRTAAAFENLIEGYADVVFLMGVSAAQRAQAEEMGLELSLLPIGREAFVFFVNSGNSISNVSANDIKRIYSGEVTRWSEIGGENNDIRAYQRPATSGSQVQLQMIMGNTPIIPAPEEDVYRMMLGMVRRVASYSNYKNSLGYSFLYYARDMVQEHDIKFLTIDGIEPTREHIASGAYPFADDFYALTVKKDGEYLNAARTENIDALLAWLQSAQGQYLVAATGYTPLN